MVDKTMFSERDLEKIVELLRSGRLSGWWNSFNGGKYLQEFERRFAEYIGVEHAVAVSSGTASVYVALRACGVTKSQVAVSSYTHIGSVAPIAMAGARPLFVDVDEFGNLDPNKIPGEAGCKAIVAAHQLGQPCDMDGVLDYASDSSMPPYVVEDCSQALGAEYQGKKAGSIGDVACFSLGGDLTKTMTTGEGGMITTNFHEVAERCRMIRNHGEKMGYRHLCFNFRMSELQALIGLLQMDGVQEQVDWQVGNAEYLIARLPKFLEAPKPPAYTNPCYYIVGTSFDSEEAGMTRNEFLEKVKERGFIGGQPRRNVGGGYSKLIHELPYYRRWHRPCPNAEKLRGEALWIDWHRHPRTREEIDELLEIFMGI